MYVTPYLNLLKKELQPFTLETFGDSQNLASYVIKNFCFLATENANLNILMKVPLLFPKYHLIKQKNTQYTHTNKFDFLTTYY